MQPDLIIIKEYCQKSNMDPAFMLLLEESGLIEIFIVEGEKYMPTSQLGELEMFSRLYYDLSINVEGIDAINNLLNRMVELRHEISELKIKLSLYESDDNEYLDIL